VALALVTGIGEARGAPALAAALAAGPARGGSLLLELGAENGERRPTVLASEGARAIEEALSSSLPELRFAARGHACHACLPAEPEALDLAAAALAEIPPGTPGVAHIPERLWQDGLAHPGLRPSGALLRVELPRDRELAALAVRDLRCHRARVKLAKRPLSWVASRRAMAGLPLGGQAERGLQRLRAALLENGSQAQALPSLLGAVAILFIVALALVAVAGALTGKARVQRAADLAALSGARSMRESLPRLLAPRRSPDGSPNPDHLTKGAYLALARTAAVAAAEANGVEARRIEVSFPDAASFAPLRARVRVVAGLAGDRGPRPTRVTAVAVAEAAPPAGGGDLPSLATGGGYQGRLVYRQGEGMRPDVAAAFDRMAAAAGRAGLALVVSSGYRSDAEQAELFARQPDPRWVAPPGHSLHRCATELDLGPPAAYAWLAANAGRFGFVRRYSWEPWHFGFDAAPPPCSAAAGVSGWGDGREPVSAVPAFVPPRFRAAIVRAAVRWNVSAALLAAQLMAESGFEPDAVSAAGAEGIAQFMPSTAAAYGLRDPYDPAAAIDSQAHLMSDLLRRFGSIQLALAAYNAGPGAVQACGCVPPYPETKTYVARILALLDGAGVAPFAESLEVRLVA
jgi:hypothetical protein